MSLLENITPLETLNLALQKRQGPEAYEALAAFLRRSYRYPFSLKKAEEVHDLLNELGLFSLRDRLLSEYLSAARIFDEEYSELGVLISDENCDHMHANDLPLPILSLPGNTYPNSHRSNFNNPGFNEWAAEYRHIIIVWGEQLSDEDHDFWVNQFRKNNEIELVFLFREMTLKTNYANKNIAEYIKTDTPPTASIHTTLDDLLQSSDLNNCKVTIAFAGARPSSSLVHFCRHYDPEFPYVICPKIIFENAEESEIVSQYISKRNSKIENPQNKQLRNSEMGTMIFACFRASVLSKYALDQSISHLQLASQEFFWRIEESGAYFINPYNSICAIDIPGMKVLSKSFRNYNSSKSIHLEQYPYSGDRKPNGNYKVPLISIYIPMYNAEDYIAEAVNSCLNQDFQDLQVTICNDGSRDNSLAIAQKFCDEYPNVKLISHPNSGISKTTMAAIELGKGPLIGQLDADDILLPEACSTLLPHLLKHEEIGCVYGSCERIDAEGDYLQNEYNVSEFSRHKMMATSIVHHFRMFKRRYYNRSHKFNEFLTNGIDYDFFMKLSEISEVKHVDKVLYRRRWHGSNTSIRNEAHQTRNTYFGILNSLHRQNLKEIRPVNVNKDNPRAIGFTKPRKTFELVFFPDYSFSNPYQKLLYQSAKKYAKLTPAPIEEALAKAENGQKIVFHLHWLNFLWKHCPDLDAANELVDNFIRKIRKLKMLGGVIVWTIHNRLSHERKFIESDLKLRAVMCSLVDYIHLHDERLHDSIFNSNPVPIEKLVRHPHGNYIGAYSDFNFSKREDQLGKHSKKFILFGQIRRYKGLQNILELIDVFKQLGVHFTIAGKPEDDKVHQLLLNKIEDNGNIKLIARRIANDEVGPLLEAHDIGVLAYSDILTSGTLRLYQSYAMGVLSPDLPSFRNELIENQSGFFYENNNSISMLDAINTMIHLPPKKMRLICQTNYLRALELDWSGELDNLWRNLNIHFLKM